MVSSNNTINNTIGAEISGVTNTLIITNPSNSASSSATRLITVGGPASGNPFLNYNISGVTDFSVGADNAHSDKFKISNNSTLGTNDYFVVNSDQTVNLPEHPSFRASVSSNQNNVTGDSTAYLVIFGTEQFDIGSNYDTGTGIFTVPVTGTYIYIINIVFSGISSLFSNYTQSILLNGSGAGGSHGLGRLVNVQTGSGISEQTGIGTISATLGDTISGFAQVQGGPKTINVVGGFLSIGLLY